MPEALDGLGPIEVTLIAAAVALALYSVQLALTQRGTVRFSVPVHPARLVLAAALAALGAGVYLVRGMAPRDLVTLAVLGAVAVSLALVRDGVGTRGICAEGLRVGWDRIDSVRAEAVAGGTLVRFRTRGRDRTLALPGADAGAVEAFLADMRKIHGAS